MTPSLILSLRHPQLGPPFYRLGQVSRIRIPTDRSLFVFQSTSSVQECSATRALCITASHVSQYNAAHSAHAGEALSVNVNV